MRFKSLSRVAKIYSQNGNKDENEHTLKKVAKINSFNYMWYFLYFGKHVIFLFFVVQQEIRKSMNNKIICQETKMSVLWISTNNKRQEGTTSMLF
jgi:hypothetical protein